MRHIVNKSILSPWYITSFTKFIIFTRFTCSQFWWKRKSSNAGSFPSNWHFPPEREAKSGGWINQVNLVLSHIFKSAIIIKISSQHRSESSWIGYVSLIHHQSLDAKGSRYCKSIKVLFFFQHQISAAVSFPSCSFSYSSSAAAGAWGWKLWLRLGLR